MLHVTRRSPAAAAAAAAASSRLVSLPRSVRTPPRAPRRRAAPSQNHPTRPVPSPPPLPRRLRRPRRDRFASPSVARSRGPLDERQEVLRLRGVVHRRARQHREPSLLLALVLLRLGLELQSPRLRSRKAAGSIQRRQTRSRKASREARRDGSKPWDGRRETNAGRESPQGLKFTTRARSYGDRREEQNAP